jgi:hypothetical protein
MPKYRIAITDAICPGQGRVAISYPGGRLVFRRGQDPLHEHEVEIPDSLAEAIRLSGYEVNLVGADVPTTIEPVAVEESPEPDADEAEEED